MDRARRAGFTALIVVVMVAAAGGFGGPGVRAELKWSPDVDQTDIATKVTDGVVTLSGVARNLHEKHSWRSWP